MDDTALGGLSQSPPKSSGQKKAPAGQSGDVDADGEIVDELRRRLEDALPRLDRAIGDVIGELEREDILRPLLRELSRTLDACERRAERLAPGVRVVNGEARYSAAWLDAQAGAR